LLFVVAIFVVVFASKYFFLDMYDPVQRKQFSNGSKESFWYGGEPIWVTAEKNGKKTAVYYWVGGEAKINGHKPTYYSMNSI